MARDGGYEAVMRLSRERPEWLPAVQACYDESADGGRFPGTVVWKRVGKSPRPLADWGILELEHTTRGDHRRYYRMPDREGVGRALRELGLK